MRHALTLAVIASAVLPRAAFADHCHAIAPLEARGMGFRGSVSFESARYETVRYEGSYEGLSVALSYTRGESRARVVLPAYRLTRNGLDARGLGDLVTEAMLAVATNASNTAVAGLSGAASLPTGEPSDELGMGHFMLMPGLWGEWRRGDVFVLTRLAYVRAVGSTSEHERHREGARPIVAPMNRSEVAGTLTAGYRLNDDFRVRGGAYGALPIGIEEGASRAVALLGADFLADWLDLGIEGQAAFAGDPFIAKLLLTAGARF